MCEILVQLKLNFQQRYAMPWVLASASTLETFCIFSWPSSLYSAKFRPISHLPPRLRVDTIECDTPSCSCGAGPQSSHDV